MKHTPTPWAVVLDEDSFANIVSPNADGTLELMIAECYGPQELQEANAAFIVHACNTHDQLLSLAERYASECGECGGKGYVYEGEAITGRGPDDVFPEKSACPSLRRHPPGHRHRQRRPDVNTTKPLAVDLEDAFCIKNADGEIILLAGRGSYASDKAMCEEVALACNTHPALVSALETAIHRLSRYESELPGANNDLRHALRLARGEK